MRLDIWLDTAGVALQSRPRPSLLTVAQTPWWPPGNPRGPRRKRGDSSPPSGGSPSIPDVASRL